VEVRERDDSRGEDDDGRPGGLSFLLDEADDGWVDEGDDADLRAQPGGRLVSQTWLVVLLVLVGGGGFVGWRWSSEADLRAVLTSSTATYGGVLSRLRLASDAAGLSAVAGTAPRAAERLQDDLDRLEGGGDKRAAVADQVAAERQVLLAVAELQGVDAAPLAVWGAGHASLSRAVREEGRTRGRLSDLDGDAAGRLPDTPGTLDRISATVGSALVGDVQRTAGELLADLGGAQRTADLRAAAQRAPAQREAVLTAAGGLRESPGAPVLDAFASALSSVAGLRDLTPATTDIWPGVRAALAEQLGAVGDADGSLTGGTVRARLPLVLSLLDGVVDRAAAAHAAWVPVHATAVSQQAADAAALAGYRDALQAWGAALAELARDLSQLADRAGAGPASVLAQDVATASATSTSLTTAVEVHAPPTGTEAAHAELVTASRAVSDPLRRASVGTSAPDCPDCPATGSPLQADLVAAVMAARDWPAVQARAEQARVAAERAVAGRALPPPPDA
jgi:hypothetical protein